MSTPAAQGYRMPAEWEKQRAIWLAWPHHRADWPGKFAPIPLVYGEIVRHLTRSVQVEMLVRDAKQEAHARSIFDAAGVDESRVRYHHIPTNRIWLRDSGPSFITNGTSKAMLHWGFNGWAKYPNHRHDIHVPARMNEALGLTRFIPMHRGKRVVLEGGGIDVNGAGCVLVTEEWLLDPKVQVRNPGFTREDYEQVFADYLGAPHTIWLGDGIVGDDTHGHIDDLARFVNANTVVVASERNKSDANYALLKDNVKRLKKATDAKGKPLNVVELPMPATLTYEGFRLPASYANFLIANDLVIMPTFNDPMDRVALNILAEAMPKHTITGIHCVDFVLGLGTLHCMSQQECL